MGLLHEDVLIDVDAKCGDEVTNKVIAYGDVHKLELMVDRNIDMGDSRFYHSDNGLDSRIFTQNYGKGYFYMIDYLNMNANDRYYSRAYYKFSHV